MRSENFQEEWDDWMMKSLRSLTSTGIAEHLEMNFDVIEFRDVQPIE